MARTSDKLLPGYSRAHLAHVAAGARNAEGLAIGGSVLDWGYNAFTTTCTYVHPLPFYALEELGLLKPVVQGVSFFRTSVNNVGICANSGRISRALRVDRSHIVLVAAFHLLPIGG